MPPNRSPKGSPLNSLLMALALVGQSPNFDIRHCQRDDLLGDWVFSGLIYRDQEMPPPNKNLDLRFSFQSGGQSELRWTRGDTSGRCRRTGVFLYDQCTLIDLVVFVDPTNTRDCRNDPDMQVRRQTFTRTEVKDNQLRLHLRLGDEPLVYLWDRAPESSRVTRTGR